jgi:hypothetical protein
MNITCFEDVWYPEHIAQTIAGMPENSSDQSICMAKAILYGCAYISQAIDHVAKNIERYSLDTVDTDAAINNIAGAINDLAKVMQGTDVVL